MMPLDVFHNGYGTQEICGGRKFWRVIQVKAIGEKKIGHIKLQSVHMPNTFSVYLCIFGGEILANSPQVAKFANFFPPPNISHVRYSVFYTLLL